MRRTKNLRISLNIYYGKISNDYNFEKKKKVKLNYKRNGICNQSLLNTFT